MGMFFVNTTPGFDWTGAFQTDEDAMIPSGFSDIPVHAGQEGDRSSGIRMQELNRHIAETPLTHSLDTAFTSDGQQLWWDSNQWH